MEFESSRTKCIKLERKSAREFGLKNSKITKIDTCFYAFQGS